MPETSPTAKKRLLASSRPHPQIAVVPAQDPGRFIPVGGFPARGREVGIWEQCRLDASRELEVGLQGPLLSGRQPAEAVLDQGIEPQILFGHVTLTDEAARIVIGLQPAEGGVHLPQQPHQVRIGAFGLEGGAQSGPAVLELVSQKIGGRAFHDGALLRPGRWIS